MKIKLTSRYKGPGKHILKCHWDALPDSFTDMVGVLQHVKE